MLSPTTATKYLAKMLLSPQAALDELAFSRYAIPEAAYNGPGELSIYFAFYPPCKLIDKS